MRNRTANIRLKIIHYLGNKCHICNQSFEEWTIYEFYNVHPEEKDILNSMIGKKGWKNIIKVLDNYVLMCANCFRRVRFKEENNDDSC